MPEPQNVPPKISGSAPTQVTAETIYLFRPSADDPDGDALQFSATGLPTWADIDAGSGLVSGTPSPANAGETADIVVSVSDGKSAATLPPFRIVVTAPPAPPPPPPTPSDAAPRISGAPGTTVQAQNSYSFLPSASDPEGQALTFSISNKPSWAAFSTATGAMSGTPGRDQDGNYDNVVISVSDGSLSASLPAFSIIVSPAPNAAPTISGSPPTSIAAEANYGFQPNASDADGDTLAFWISGKPSWAAFDATTGAIWGMPTEAQAGTYSNITIQVSDGKVTSSLPAFSIVVSSKANAAPTISGSPSTSIAAEANYSFQPSASDADGDTLAFWISGKPSWAAFDAATGAIWGMPTAAQAGTYSNITIQVSDGKVTSSLPAFSIVVSSKPNAAPTISGSPSTSIAAEANYGFQPNASDADGDTLTFSITGKPSWAAFDAATGSLWGTPTTAQAGTYSNITIQVSDGRLTSTLPAFSIVVSSKANAAPTISGSPSTSIAAEANYGFQPSASDPDGDTLTFSITGKPSWLAFDAATGAIWGKPTEAQAGTYSNVAIQVSDGRVTASLPAFSIIVSAKPNTAPTIGGSPLTSLAADASYGFTPSASDPDGDTLTFSITGKPSWAAFDAATGSMWGTPTAAQAGTYGNIVIRVSDGSSTTSLPTFSVVVNAPTTGSATLSWTAPTQNTDGSAITDLSGYRVYYGTSSASLGTMIQIPNPGVSTYVVDNLRSGTYYFAVSAYNSSGSESDRSTVGSKAIP